MTCAGTFLTCVGIETLSVILRKGDKKEWCQKVAGKGSWGELVDDETAALLVNMLLLKT